MTEQYLFSQTAAARRELEDACNEAIRTIVIAKKSKERRDQAKSLPVRAVLSAVTTYRGWQAEGAAKDLHKLYGK